MRTLYKMNLGLAIFITLLAMPFFVPLASADQGHDCAAWRETRTASFSVLWSMAQRASNGEIVPEADIDQFLADFLVEDGYSAVWFGVSGGADLTRTQVSTLLSLASPPFYMDVPATVQSEVITVNNCVPLTGEALFVSYTAVLDFQFIGGFDPIHIANTVSSLIEKVDGTWRFRFEHIAPCATPTCN